MEVSISRYNGSIPQTPEEWENYRKYYENKPKSRIVIIDDEEYEVINKYF